MKQPFHCSQRSAIVGSSLRLILSILLLLIASSSQSAELPACPTSTNEPFPAFSELDAQPAVASWKKIASVPDACLVPLESPAAWVVALSGRFKQVRSVDEIAQRLGAISATKGLLYWSVTDQGWRELLSDAFATPDADSEKKREDFSAEEILSGKALHFAQNDTRSWGLNIYRARTVESSIDHLVFESDNVSPVRLGPLVLFKPGDVRSVLFIDREGEDTWTYYALTVVRRAMSSAAVREKSLINRQAAFYRLLAGQAVDQEPPLAP